MMTGRLPVVDERQLPEKVVVCLQLAGAGRLFVSGWQLRSFISAVALPDQFSKKRERPRIGASYPCLAASIELSSCPHPLNSYHIKLVGVTEMKELHTPETHPTSSASPPTVRVHTSPSDAHHTCRSCAHTKVGYRKGRLSVTTQFHYLSTGPCLRYHYQVEPRCVTSSHISTLFSREYLIPGFIPDLAPLP